MKILQQNAKLAALLILANALAPSSVLFAGDGQWSRYAMQVPSGRGFVVPSPDRTRTMVVNGMTLSVLEGRQPMDGAESIGLLLPAEIGWSPDGKAFFITSSDGGSGGTWDVGLFLLERDRFIYSSIADESMDLFMKEYPCTAPLLPNAGLLRFVPGTMRVLLAVEAPMDSSCADRDALRGFIVEVPSGKVLRELDRTRLVEEWGEALGSRFDRLLRGTGP